MDLLTRSQLQKAGELLRDAERGDEVRMDEVRTCALFLDMPRKDLKQYSIVRGIASMLDSISQGMSRMGLSRLGASQLDSCDTGIRFGGLEGEVHRALAAKLGPLVHGGAFYVPSDVLYQRDMQVAVGSAGGFLVQSTLGSFIEYLRNVSVVFRLGAQRVAGQVGNLVLPKQTGAGTTVWLSNETVQASESNATFAQVSGTPKTAAIYTEMSRQLLKQISPDTEAAVKRSLAANIAVTVDAAAITGSGASGQPVGILSTAGIGTVSGTTLGYTGLVEAQVDIADSNAILDPRALGYVTTPTVAQTLKSRQRFTGTDSPLWAGAIHAGTIEGVQALSTKNTPASTMIYGDWSGLIIAEWSSLIVEVNPFTNFPASIVGVRCLWTVDVLVQHPLSFTAITSIT